MNSLKTILALAMLVHSSGCFDTITGRSLDEVMAANEKSPWLVLVTTDSHSSAQLFRGVTYGSLVKPTAVLTSAEKVFYLNMREIKVFANCKLRDRLDCDVRKVKDVRYAADLNDDFVQATDFILLRLMSAFDASPRISPIPLVLSSQKPNYSDCLIYRWDVVTATNELDGRNVNESGVIHRQFPVTVNNSSDVRMSEDGLDQLKKQQDCVLENCAGATGSERINRIISFLGSPVVCSLEEEKDKVVQIGFTTVYYKINYESPTDDGSEAIVETKHPDYVPFSH